MAMIPRLRPYFQFDDAMAMLHTGPDSIAKFENAFARHVNVRYGLLLPNGRSAISLFLNSSGIKNKKVVLPAYNCRVVVSAVAASGNIHWFVDSASGQFNMDLDQAIEEVDKDTVAMIVTAMYGYPVDSALLHKIKQRHPEITIIGDGALALFTWDNSRNFCGNYDLSFFSFGLGKQMSIVEGGILVTDHKDLY